MANIVICCDGTSNEFGGVRTNVTKLVFCLDQDPQLQRIYYHPGVGTMAHPGAIGNVVRFLTRLGGLALGSGLDRDVRDLYTYLINTWQPGDRIYMFGFSRGAFTVRIVAALIHAYGLMAKGNDALVPYAVRYLLDTIAGSTSNEEVKARLDRADEFKATFASARRCTIHFVGVWDTVGSVGWFTNPLVVPYTADNPSVEHARHAMAIDERRAFFRANRWRRNNLASDHGPLDLKQVWFAGSHGDVGGGYDESESGLSTIALRWMIEEAQAQGLHFDAARVAEMLGPLPNGRERQRVIHDSLKWYWRPCEYVPKPRRETGGWRMNLSRKRDIRPDETLHRSVLEQPDAYLSARGFPGEHPIDPPLT